MAENRRTTIDYAPASAGGAKLASRVGVGLSAYPAITVLMLHVLYAVEWGVNGERPIPPFHGPQNSVEAVLYFATGLLCIAALPACAFHAIALLVLLLAAPFARRDWRLALLLPTASWAAGWLLIGWDPIGAFDFWVD